MDFTRLSQGEKVAGVSGILLILFMFVFKWFGLKVSGGAGAFAVSVEGSQNAWGSYGFIDIVLFITAPGGDRAGRARRLRKRDRAAGGSERDRRRPRHPLGCPGDHQHHQPARLGCRPFRHRHRAHSQDRRVSRADRGRRGGRGRLHGDAGGGDVVRQRGRALRRRWRRRRRRLLRLLRLRPRARHRRPAHRRPTRSALSGVRPTTVRERRPPSGGRRRLSPGGRPVGGRRGRPSR